MISDVLDARFLQEATKLIKEQLQRDSTTGRSGGGLGAEDLTAKDYVLASEMIDNALGEASQRANEVGKVGSRRGRDDNHPETAFFSRDPVLSNIQSALEFYFENPQSKTKFREEGGGSGRRGGIRDIPPAAGKRLENNAIGSARGRRVLDRFSITDPGWVSSLVAMGIRRFRTPHGFNARPASSVNLGEMARLIMVGDWGSGVPRAQLVGQQMRKHVEEALQNGLECHVLHLGDVYYSGWEYEYRDRFLPYWPVKPDEAGTVGSWCLNGNHDMYSGGYGYFDYLLSDPRFARQEKSSFFRIATPYWQILGLDTAWDDDGLKDPQAAWANEMAGSHALKTMLLSHHQLFSARENGPSVGKTMKEKMGALLRDGGVEAAVWGHEHRCVIYEPHDNVQYARLVGHGGVPVYTDSGPLPSPGIFQTIGSLKKGLETWANMGFAVFDFIGPIIEARYIDENGNVEKQETIG